MTDLPGILKQMDPDSTERTTNEEIGMISGMMRGKIRQFEFRGLTVKRIGDSIMVFVNGRQKGGAAHVSSGIPATHDWLAKKARMYGKEVTP